jgi:hypothetical protein
MARAAVEEGATGAQALELGLGLRDASATIVGFCTTGHDVPRDVPTLRVSGRRLEPVGGAFTRASGRSFNYAFYPPTEAREVGVVQASTTLGTLRFETTASAPCRVRASAPFSVTACGALVVVEWRSPLRLDARRLELIDAETWESGDRSRQLGFFLLDAESGAGGVVLRFAFRRPSEGSVSVLVSRVYLERPSGRIAELVLRPPASARLTLRGVR